MTKVEQSLSAETALTDAMLQFEYYARNHAAKGTPDADAKAETNRQMAARMKLALDALARHRQPDAGDVERVALAILNSDRIAGGLPIVESGDPILANADEYMNNARAAIAAMGGQSDAD